MTNLRLLLALSCLIACGGLLSGTDLRKIDRTIGREPTYHTKMPMYCLVAVGPSAETRIWLVLDGDVLYVDRNGNGDLTDEGEKVQPLPTLLTGFLRPDEKEPKALTYRCTVGKDLEISVLTINDNYVQGSIGQIVGFQEHSENAELYFMVQREPSLLAAIKYRLAVAVHVEDAVRSLNGTYSIGSHCNHRPSATARSRYRKL